MNQEKQISKKYPPYVLHLKRMALLLRQTLPKLMTELLRW